ncbi:DUF5683 domain-containing protein [Hymenobacter tenuis]
MYSARAFALLVSPLLVALPLSGKAQQIVPTPDSTKYTERFLRRALTRPRIAMVLALALPGAGQVYNRTYWKLPIVYGLLGGTTYGLVHYQRLYKEYATGKRELLEGSSVKNLSGSTVRLELTNQGVLVGLDRYRTQRDRFIGYTALAYGITVLDALVDAHLHDFDVNDNLTLHMRPTLQLIATGSVAPSMQWQLRIKAPAKTTRCL